MLLGRLRLYSERASGLLTRAIKQVPCRVYLFVCLFVCLSVSCLSVYHLTLDYLCVHLIPPPHPPITSTTIHQYYEHVGGLKHSAWLQLQEAEREFQQGVSKVPSTSISCEPISFAVHLLPTPSPPSLTSLTHPINHQLSTVNPPV